MFSDFLHHQIEMQDLIVLWLGWMLCDVLNAFVQGFRDRWKEHTNVRVDQTEAKETPRD